jgi:hypothetical protein
MKILHLTLKRKPFEVMITGEKFFEIREKGKWINSRLFDENGNPKVYDLIKFVNGYGKDKPYFVAEWNGFGTCCGMDNTFSNGFHLEFNDERWIIYFGKIIEKGNLKEKVVA